MANVSGAAPKARRAPPSRRRETHSDEFQIGEMPAITEKTDRADVSRMRFDGQRVKHGEGNILLLNGIEVTEDYLAELAFNEEPVDIILVPSQQKNAASIFESWNNGKGAEVLVNGQWIAIQDLPVDERITVKRKTLEQVVRARVTNVNTAWERPYQSDMPRNDIRRSTTPVHSFTVLKDANPRGADWLESIMRRPM